MHPLLEPVDWAREGEDAVELLRALLRFDTTNPPGAEADCIGYLAEHLRAAGLQPEVLSSGPGRANLVARLPSGDGMAGPLLLHGHVDVVPAEADRWRHPPFAGEVHDGQVWGRGAVDMKNMVAMSAAVLALLARLGRPLRRDVIFAAVAVADHHPGAVAVPSITPGFTDAKFWSRLGASCYGFAPLRLEPGDPPYVDLFHGDDERVPVAGFTAGLRMLADAVARFCGPSR